SSVEDVQETSAVTTRCAMCPLALQEPGGGGHAVSDLLEPSNHGPAAMFKFGASVYLTGDIDALCVLRVCVSSYINGIHIPTQPLASNPDSCNLASCVSSPEPQLTRVPELQAGKGEQTSGRMNRSTVDPLPGHKDGTTAPSSHRLERRRPFVNLATAAAHLDLATAARDRESEGTCFLDEGKLGTCRSGSPYSPGVPMRGGQPRLRSTKLSDTAVKHNLCASLSPGCQG
ncbi:Averufin oxidase A, partial [Dissostichus eleginoides]